MIKREQPAYDNRKKHVHKKSAIGKTGGRMLYAAGAVGLILLLVFSFYAPQLIFGLRDKYLCRDIVREEQENTDVTLLGAAYEASLGRRMRTFSVGLERGRDYYVSSHKMPVTQEIYEILDEKDMVLYQLELIEVMMDIGIISYSFQNGFTVNDWKQYVIYSDEYKEGVNFIIWYLEIEGSDGKRMELLVDAEDATLYGVYAERNTVLSVDQAKKWSRLVNADLFTLYEMRGVALEEWWYYISYYYQSISREELEKYIDNRSNAMQIDAEINQSYEEVVTIQYLENVWYNGGALTSPDSNTFIFHLLFPGRSLDFSIRLFKDEREDADDEEIIYYLYPDVYMGVDPICQMIPEFAERF